MSKTLRASIVIEDADASFGPVPVSSQKHPRWVLLGVVLVVAVASLGRFDNGFVHDDVAMIASGFFEDPRHIGQVFGAHTLIAHGKSSTLPMDTYRPISLLTFFWDAFLSGKAPWSYHLTNLALHLGVVVSLFSLIRVLLPQVSSWAQIAATLLFGLSPQLVEAHVWINGRSDPLTTLFGIWAVSSYLRAEGTEGKERFGAALLAGSSFLLGLLSKEVLLFVLPCFLLKPVRSARWTKSFVNVAPIFLAALIYLVLRVNALSGLRAARDPEQIRVSLRNLPILWLDGLRETFAPSQLYLRSMRDDYAAIQGSAQFGILALGLILVITVVALRKRFALFAWSMCAYAASLAPVALISAVLWPGFGRFLYLPIALLSPGIAELLDALERRMRAGPSARLALPAISVLTAAYFLLFAFAVHRYTRDYRDEETLYRAVLREHPQGANGHARLAAYLLREKHTDEALHEYARAIALDVREPSYRLQAIYAAMLTRDFALAEKFALDAAQHLPTRYETAFRALASRAREQRSNASH